MIHLRAYSGVFTHLPADLQDHPNLSVTAMTSGGRTTSAAGEYALAAAAGLDAPLPETGLVCISGAAGPMVDAFDRAWNASSDSLLTGKDFPRRAKRIHPFTLLRALRNGPAAALSMKLGLTGPCLNLLEGAASLPLLWPNLSAMLKKTPQILLTLTAAGEQKEEGALRQARVPGNLGFEGALCLLLGNQSGLGILEPAQALEPFPQDADLRASPIPALALDLVRAFRQAEAHIPIIDPHQPNMALTWRRT